MKKLTTYERKVKSGQLAPLQGLDSVLIDDMVYSIIKDNRYTTEELSCIEELWDEIEFIYKDDVETMNRLKKTLNIT